MNSNLAALLGQAIEEFRRQSDEDFWYGNDVWDVHLLQVEDGQPAVFEVHPVHTLPNGYIETNLSAPLVAKGILLDEMSDQDYEALEPVPVADGALCMVCEKPFADPLDYCGVTIKAVKGRLIEARNAVMHNDSCIGELTRDALEFAGYGFLG